MSVNLNSGSREMGPISADMQHSWNFMNRHTDSEIPHHLHVNRFGKINEALQEQYRGFLVSRVVGTAPSRTVRLSLEEYF